MSFIIEYYQMITNKGANIMQELMKEIKQFNEERDWDTLYIKSNSNFYKITKNGQTSRVTIIL